MSKGFNIENKIALVTGANRGIGKVIVESLINRGAVKVYTAVRNLDSVDSLQTTFPNMICPVVVDLRQVETINAAAKLAQDVDLVINNAGVLTNTSVFDRDAAEALWFEFETNVLGLLHMSAAFAPALIKRQGAFVQINSVASMRAVPFIGTYSASKAAAYSMTQSIWQELREQNVRVVSVHPGPIATDMADQAGISHMAESPRSVAEGIIEALKTGQFHVFPDSLAKKVGEHYASYAENVIEHE